MPIGLLLVAYCFRVRDDRVTYAMVKFVDSSGFLYKISLKTDAVSIK